MAETKRIRSLVALALYVAPVLMLGFCDQLVERARSMRHDERGLETLEVALMILMALVILGVAINNLGGSLSGFFGRLVAKINSLG